MADKTERARQDAQKARAENAAGYTVKLSRLSIFDRVCDHVDALAAELAAAEEREAGLREQLAAAEAVFENAGEGAKDLLARAKAAEKERDRAQSGWDACAELLDASGSDYQRELEIARAHEYELMVLRGRLEKAQAALHKISLWFVPEGMTTVVSLRELRDFARAAEKESGS